MGLPSPGDPYNDGVGEVVALNDETREFERLDIAEYQERLIISAFKNFKPVKECTADDLPEGNSHDQKAMAIIIALRLLGLSIDDIATYLEVRTEEIERVINLPSTQSTFERIFKSIINVNATSIHGRVSAHAHNALSVILQLMNSEKTRDDIRFKAGQDVLDRSGTNAEQLFNIGKDAHRDDELRISFLEDEDTGGKKVDVTVKRR